MKKYRWTLRIGVGVIFLYVLFIQIVFGHNQWKDTYYPISAFKLWTGVPNVERSFEIEILSANKKIFEKPINYKELKYWQNKRNLDHYWALLHEYQELLGKDNMAAKRILLQFEVQFFPPISGYYRIYVIERDPLEYYRTSKVRSIVLLGEYYHNAH